jgi:pyruvate dehydrogenase E2 component (dihydrolipoamide acetyltransferase)
MAKLLEMPKLSPTMEEGVLTAWHKKAGDAIEVDDLLAEVETDKATMEFRAFDKGTILELLVPAGATVKLGQAVAVLGAKGEDISALVAKARAPSDDTMVASAPAPVTSAPQASVAPTTPAPPAVGRRSARTTSDANVLARTEQEPDFDASAHDARGPDARGPAAQQGRALASPFVRKVARELGVDLGAVRGTGENNRVTADDVETAARAPRTVGAATATPTVGTALAVASPATLKTTGLGGVLAAPIARPLSPMRKTIARRLVESKQTVPHFYLTVDVDAAELAKAREQVNIELAAGAPKGADPEKVSVNDLIVRAVALALVRVPECNATFTPDAILVHQRVDISIAVAITDGLVTPVVRDADKKSVLAIAREVRELAARARARKLKPEEMQDGTFSISNLGMFGIDEFSAVINPPEGAILAIGRVRDEPVVKDGAVALGKRLGMTLSCDHRVVDGAIGAAFLAELRALLEHPLRILAG